MLQAQNDQGNSGGISEPISEPDTTQQIPGWVGFLPQDTFEVKVYHALAPEELLPYPDTLLGNYLQQSDPIRRQAVDYAYLGSMGTPAYPILYEVGDRQGLQLGFRQFDLYKISLEDIRYFKNNRTFTETYYAQPHTRNDFILTGAFSRNFPGRWTLAADYARISHVGKYSHQKSRHTSFVNNASYSNKDGRYQAYVSYSFNDIQQEDNGGVSPDAVFDCFGCDNRMNIPVHLKDAFTRNTEHTLAYTQYYNLLKPKRDSTGVVLNDRRLDLGHAFAYEWGRYKFHDKSPIAEADFYGDLLIYSGGLRHFLGWNKLDNSFRVSTYKMRREGQAPRDKFQAGLRHTLHHVRQSNRDSTVNNLFAFGGWDYHPGRFLTLSVWGQYTIGDNRNEYLVRGRLQLGAGRFGQLTAEVQNQRFSPDLLQSRAYLSSLELYRRDFVKPIATSLGATYEIPKWNSRLSFRYHILGNHIFYDTEALPRQLPGSIHLLQGVIRQDFRFGIFGSENTIVLQQSNSNALRVPSLFMKNSLFVEGKVFKRVMLARVGVDFRMNSGYFANDYQPVLGRFHLQNNEKIGWYPATDFFITFKVRTFRAFAKMENMAGWFINGRHYQTPGYPLADPHFRFGVSWRFVD